MQLVWEKNKSKRLIKWCQLDITNDFGIYSTVVHCMHFVIVLVIYTMLRFQTFYKNMHIITLEHINVAIKRGIGIV